MPEARKDRRVTALPTPELTAKIRELIDETQSVEKVQTMEGCPVSREPILRAAANLPMRKAHRIAMCVWLKLPVPT